MAVVLVKAAHCCGVWQRQQGVACGAALDKADLPEPAAAFFALRPFREAKEPSKGSRTSNEVLGLAKELDRMQFSSAEALFDLD